MSKEPNKIEPGNYDGVIVKQTYNPLVKKIKPLDFFCSCGYNRISYSIRIITKNLSPDREAEFNHAGIFPDGSACTLEALWKLTSTNFFENYEGCNVIVAHYNGMTSELALKALKETNKHIGQWYPALRLFLHLFNIAHIFHWTNFLVCSEYVAKVLYKAGARHSHFYGTTPDTLADEAERELNKERTGPKYNIIYKGKLPYNFYKFCDNCNTYWLIPQNHYYCPKCKVHLSVFPISRNIELNKLIETYNSQKYLYKANRIAKTVC